MGKELDEGRKRAFGVIAAIFACRKLSLRRLPVAGRLPHKLTLRPDVLTERLRCNREPFHFGDLRVIRPDAPLRPLDGSRYQRFVVSGWEAVKQLVRVPRRVKPRDLLEQLCSNLRRA